MKADRFSIAHNSPADHRARAVEEQMTDEERFSLLVSVMGENPVIPLPRDERIPEGTAMSSGYTPGVPRLGVLAFDERRKPRCYQPTLVQYY
jgi:beta-glucosidase